MRSTAPGCGTRGLTLSRPAHGATSRRAGRGFTMIELVVVMVVMGILSALAAPRLVQRSALSERGVSDRVKSLLRQARGLAIAQQRDVCVLLAVPQASAVYVAAGACAAAQAVQDPVGGGPLVVEVPADVLLGGATTVRFNARGQLVPAANLNVTVGAQTLTVYRETGATL